MPDAGSTNLTCIACPSGFSTSRAAASFFRGCFAGSVQTAAGKKSCDVCPRGFIGSDVGQSRPCEACAAGQIAPAKLVPCAACPAGGHRLRGRTHARFVERVTLLRAGAGRCDKCPTGYAQRDNASTICFLSSRVIQVRVARQNASHAIHTRSIDTGIRLAPSAPEGAQHRVVRPRAVAALLASLQCGN